MDASPDDKGRYFFAVWPDAVLRESLVEWRRAMRVDRAAREVPAANLHMTVAFLGWLSAAQLEAARQAAAAAPWCAVSLAIDRIGYWQRSRIIWAGSRRGSEPLTAASEHLRERLRRLGLRIDTRHFVPHVTLYRKARRRPRWPGQTLTWRIDELCLVQSRLSAGSACYDIVDRWSAAGDVK